LLDGTYTGAPIDNYAAKLRARFMAGVVTAAPRAAADRPSDDRDDPGRSEPVDVEAVRRAKAIAGLRDDRQFQRWMSGGGTWWGYIQRRLAEHAPGEDVLGGESSFDWAGRVMVQALNEILGRGRWIAKSAKNEKGQPRQRVVPTTQWPPPAPEHPDDEAPDDEAPDEGRAPDH
jgi:hypothetical protein